MGGRDHSIECEVCGWSKGGLNDLRCDCDGEADPFLAAVDVAESWRARADLAESIARRALVEGLAEAERLRLDLLTAYGEAEQLQVAIGGLTSQLAHRRQAQCTDAARAERERWAAWFDTRVAFCREQQQVAAMERQLVVADQFGRLAAEREQTAAVLRSNNIPSANNGDHAKGGG